MEDFKLLGTPNYNTIQNLCKDAQESSKMMALIGYPGAGKTTGFESYMEKSSNVFLIQVTASMNAKNFYRELASTIGCEINYQIDLYTLIKNICDELEATHDKKLLIIDEAGKFQPKFLEYIHELRDKTKLTTGIVISGPEYFKHHVDEWVNKRIVGMEEFKRRVSHWEFLNPLKKSEIKNFINAYGITDPLFIKEACLICKDYGAVEDMIFFYNQSKEK